MSAPTSEAVKQLYSSMLRSSRSFSSYNFRQYFLRRTKTTFREMQNEQDPQKKATLYAQAVKDNAVLKRSALVNQLYGGSRLVVEDQKPTRDRGDS